MPALFASITSNQHILDSADWSYGSEPFGRNGSNLTIVILSMNKVSLTMRLLRSIVQYIPHFAGHILIADNGSHADTLTTLTNYLLSFPLSHRLLTFPINYGVAGGRNRAFASVTTDWIVSLDNDIYLVANPLPQITRDITLTGAHFLSLPLLDPDKSHWYSFGGNLEVTYHNGEPHLHICTELPPKTHVTQTASYGFSDLPFFGSFIFGGASAIKLPTFNTLGGFDDNMFVGFEDIDFSLRVYKAGLRVACSTTAAFVHDHAKSTSDTDAAYETVRYSRSLLRDSATYLQQKSGFTIWGNGEDSWLDEKLTYQGLTTTHSPSSYSKTSLALFDTRPKIALIIDAYNWAFHNIAKQIQNHLKEKFTITIFTLSELADFDTDTNSSLLTANIDPYALALARLFLIAPQYDLVHIFQKEFLLNYYSPSFSLYFERLGISFETLLLQAKVSTSFTTAVYDHANTSNRDLSSRAELFSKIIDGYVVSSQRLHKIYTDNPDIANPHSVISDGIDLRLFYPIQLSRFSTAQKRSLTIGWAGNSRWGDSEIDHKGFISIIEPAVRQLQQEGIDISLHIQDRNISHLPLHQMVNFYKQLDLYVCMSDAEGTPNPVLEAMACGVPVLSTDVGIVSTVVGDKQRALILNDRSIHGLKSMLRYIISNRHILLEISAENQISIRNFTWETQTTKFSDFFSDFIHVTSKQSAQLPTN